MPITSAPQERYRFDSARGEKDEHLPAERLEGVDVGPRRQLLGQDMVAGPVPGQECPPLAFQCPHDDVAAGLPEGRDALKLLYVSEGIHAVAAAAADEADPCPSQVTAPPLLSGPPATPRMAVVRRRS